MTLQRTLRTRQRIQALEARVLFDARDTLLEVGDAFARSSAAATVTGGPADTFDVRFDPARDVINEVSSLMNKKKCRLEIRERMMGD